MKFCTSLFGQILQIIPRNLFLRLVHQRGAERHAKGFSSWSQYLAMLFCQLAQAKSLLEISDGLAVTCGKLSHLGVSGAPAKSTLAYANAHRPWQLYQDTFFHLLDFCRKESPAKKKKFRFNNKLFSLGSTTIGAIYRDCWEIELFFKVSQQHLKVKTFVGTSPNALKTQIWTALIALLLLKYLQFRSRCNLPLCRLVALLLLNLFSCRNLWYWLNDPFEAPPQLPGPRQLEFAF